MSKTLLIAFITFFLLLTLSTSEIITLSENLKNTNFENGHDLTIRNVLVFIFPGGKSHNFVFKTLFEYTYNRALKEEDKFKYVFHILVHNFDVPIWKNSDHKIYGYGDENSYKEKFFDAMEEAKNDPVMGYMGFNNAMKHLYRDFLNEAILMETLKQIKFELIISDIVNLLNVFLARELKIPKKIYVNPTCAYAWLNTLIEYNPAYVPGLGTSFTEDMNFFERFTNFFLAHATNLFYDFYNIDQNKVFEQYGYKEPINPFDKTAFYMNQCVDGFHYSIPLPSNFVSIGAIMPRPAEPINHHQIIDFMQKYEEVIYVSQGTITKVFRLEMFLNTFKEFENVGFILSNNNLFDNISLNIPRNVLILDWVPQNDLLGHDKVKMFITHGGINSILESLYHAKPMIAIGLSIDQTNGATVVGYRKAGISITDEKYFTKEKLVLSIKKVLSNPVYKENCQRISKYVRIKDGKNIFFFWLNYIFEVGSEHLSVKPYINYNHFQKYNMDIMMFFIFIICLLIYIIRRIFYRIYKF